MRIKSAHNSVGATAARVRFRRRCLSVAVATVAIAGIAAVPAHATWSVIGTDEETGEVGVAVASCVPVEVVQVPVIAPGYGAGASQALLNGASGEPMLAALESGATAEEVIATVTDPAFDPSFEARQFGAVTLSGTAAGFTGSATEPVALNLTNSTNTASVQGNILVSDAVVADALAAFDATEGSLSDKLLAGLEAGSAAGGDSRCGARTASSAALIVAKPGDPAWQATGVMRADPGLEQSPSIYLSVIPSGTSNPVTELRQMYETTPVVDGKMYNRQVPWLVDQFGLPPLLVYIVVGFVLVVAALVVATVWVLRRRRRRQAPTA